MIIAGIKDQVASMHSIGLYLEFSPSLKSHSDSSIKDVTAQVFRKYVYSPPKLF